MHTAIISIAAATFDFTTFSSRLFKVAPFHTWLFLLVLHRYAFFHIYRYRLFAYSCNRYADIYRYSSILQNRRGGAENHLKFMCINCICNINVINCVGGRLLPFFYSFATNSFHGKGSQVVIKQLSQLIKQCFQWDSRPFVKSDQLIAWAADKYTQPTI